MTCRKLLTVRNGTVYSVLYINLKRYTAMGKFAEWVEKASYDELKASVLASDEIKGSVKEAFKLLDRLDCVKVQRDVELMLLIFQKKAADVMKHFGDVPFANEASV